MIDYLKTVENTKGSAFFYTPLLYKNAKSYFFSSYESILTAYNKDELKTLPDNLDILKSKGYFAYGYITYEAGYLFSEAFNSQLSFLNQQLLNKPLAKFHVFSNKNVLKINTGSLDFKKADNWLKQNNFKIDNFRLSENKETYFKNFSKIKHHISKGDVYQLNYTVNSEFEYIGNISALFLNLVLTQSAKYIAFINDGDYYILSISPELFFERKKKTITCKPMKGTFSRGCNIREDEHNRSILANSMKNRAENVMIVDLLRNDLSRIDNIEKVWVSKLNQTEKYESLFQMTSTVNAKSKRNISLKNIFTSLFPCGSVTGAPKIRAMEIIHKLENRHRGIYTGALGMTTPEKDIFNIPIRTICIEKIQDKSQKIKDKSLDSEINYSNHQTLNTKHYKGEMGLGSGIVWDSDPEEEYDEVLLKGNFLHSIQQTRNNKLPTTKLIETMLVDNGKIFFYNEHMQRLRKTAAYFLYPFNEIKIRRYIHSQINKLPDYQIARFHLELDKWGHLQSQIIYLKSNAREEAIIKISDKHVNSSDCHLYFKTTFRDLYESEYSKFTNTPIQQSNNSLAVYEVIFRNEKNQITEGSKTNIFIRKNSFWLTPAVDCGLLNGIYRQYFISKHPDCIETILYSEDLQNADKIILTNSVRKEIKVTKII